MLEHLSRSGPECLYSPGQPESGSRQPYSHILFHALCNTDSHLIPLAVSVNGEGIPIPEFNAELARYQQAQTALGNTVSLDAATKAVRDEFVDTLLLEQAATASRL